MVLALAGDSTMTSDLPIQNSQLTDEVHSRQLADQAIHLELEQRRQHARLRNLDRPANRVDKQRLVGMQRLEDRLLLRSQRLLEKRWLGPRLIRPLLRLNGRRQ